MRDPIAIVQDARGRQRKLAEFPPEADIHQQGLFEGSPDIFCSVQRKIFNPDSFIDVDLQKEAPPFNASSVSERFSGQREIIFQPPLPEYPEWRQEEFLTSFAIFKIYISSQGLVEQLVCVQASGNPEIDASLARYIGRWRFAPAPGEKGQWQTARIDLDFSRGVE